MYTITKFCVDNAPNHWVHSEDASAWTLTRGKFKIQLHWDISKVPSSHEFNIQVADFTTKIQNCIAQFGSEFGIEANFAPVNSNNMLIDIAQSVTLDIMWKTPLSKGSCNDSTIFQNLCIKTKSILIEVFMCNDFDDFEYPGATAETFVIDTATKILLDYVNSEQYKNIQIHRSRIVTNEYYDSNDEYDLYRFLVMSLGR